MEEEISSSGTAANAADPYSVQQTSQEQPETQRQLSEVRERLNELVQQNSQVLLSVITQFHDQNLPLYHSPSFKELWQELPHETKPRLAPWHCTASEWGCPRCVMQQAADEAAAK